MAWFGREPRVRFGVGDAGKRTLSLGRFRPNTDIEPGAALGPEVAESRLAALGWPTAKADMQAS